MFESCTEALIGKVQQGAIGFSDADEGILRVARALGDVCGCLEVLCAPPARTWWREAPYALLKKLPEVPAGDAAALRCVARRGILLRCMQMILLPPMIVNAIVEAGSALATKERQSLERRLGTHFHVPLRVCVKILLLCVIASFLPIGLSTATVPVLFELCFSLASILFYSLALL